MFSMPPWAAWWRGRQTIAEFAKDALEFCPETPVPTRANGQPAVAYYSLDDETRRYTASAIDVLTLEGELIRELTAFIQPAFFPRFGLPAELD